MMRVQAARIAQKIRENRNGASCCDCLSQALPAFGVYLPGCVGLPGLRASVASSGKGRDRILQWPQASQIEKGYVHIGFFQTC